ncbi:hypothetical protein Tco_0458679 [Tanacetum coccineum]
MINDTSGRQTHSSREIRTEIDEEQQTNTDSTAKRSEQRWMKSSRQIQIQQQRGPNRGRRRAADKYRFSSREVRTEVDEEQIRQTAADSDRQQQI